MVWPPYLGAPASAGAADLEARILGNAPEEMVWLPHLGAPALAGAAGLEARIPENAEEEMAWAPQLEEGEEEAVVMEHGVLLLVGEIQRGGGFSPDEFRRGF